MCSVELNSRRLFCCNFSARNSQSPPHRCQSDRLVFRMFFHSALSLVTHRKISDEKKLKKKIVSQLNLNWISSRHFIIDRWRILLLLRFCCLFCTSLENRRDSHWKWFIQQILFPLLLMRLHRSFQSNFPFISLFTNARSKNYVLFMRLFGVNK